MNIHTVWPNFVNWAISVTTCPLDISKVLMGLTFNRETANNLAVKYKDWQILTIRSRNAMVLITGASVTWQNIFLDLRTFSGLWKGSWIVNYFRFSWKLFVDLWIKPGFEIDFSIWQTSQNRFVWKISILNIFFGFAKYFWILPLRLP